MKVEIWSDVVCPWRYIGKRRFEAALARFAHRDQVEVVWRSFELDPRAPPRVGERPADRLAAKYGLTREQALETHARLTRLAADVGLSFRFDIAQSGNTFDAHRLLHLAAERNVQDAAKERLLRAYFSEGEPIGDRETLVRLVAEVGVPADEVRAVLAGQAYADAVRADEAEATALGITGVPFFVLDRRFGVSGAQPPEVLLAALHQAWAASHPIERLTPVGAAASKEAGACTDETCAI